MGSLQIKHTDERGCFKFNLPISAIREIMSPELLDELKKFKQYGPIREDNIERKDLLQRLINAGLICGFYFRSPNCCYGLTTLGHSLLNTPE